MATYVPAKRATELIFYMGLVSQSTGQFQANPTLAAGDVKVSKDGGALANLTTLPAVTPAASKMVKVTISSTEMTADNVTLIFSDAAGAEWDDVIVNIQTAARQIDDLAYPATSGRSMVVDASGLVDANTVKVGPSGSGTAQTAGDVIGDTNDIQTRLPAALVSGRMDSSVGAMAANTLTASALATDAVTEMQSGLATSAALATVQSDTDNIQTRLPAALSGDGFMKADLKSIEDELTSGYNATLRLKQIDISNAGDSAIYLTASGNGVHTVNILSESGSAITAETSSSVPVVNIYNGGAGDAINLESATGKSINVPNDIALPSGDLDDQLQTIDNLIDTEVAAIKAKTDQLTFTNANQVDANIQAVNDTNLTGNGSAGNPWGPV
jgi:hypothetical protein